MSSPTASASNPPPPRSKDQTFRRRRRASGQRRRCSTCASARSSCADDGAAKRRWMWSCAGVATRSCAGAAERHRSKGAADMRWRRRRRPHASTHGTASPGSASPGSASTSRSPTSLSPSSAAAVAYDVSLWTIALGQAAYIVGWCRDDWRGWSMAAFNDMWALVRLSLESPSYSALRSGTWACMITVLTGHLQDAQIAIDSLGICMNVNGWEGMIFIGLNAAISVRVSIELALASSS